MPIITCIIIFYKKTHTHTFFELYAQEYLAFYMSCKLPWISSICFSLLPNSHAIIRQQHFVLGFRIHCLFRFIEFVVLSTYIPHGWSKIFGSQANSRTNLMWFLGPMEHTTTIDYNQWREIRLTYLSSNKSRFNMTSNLNIITNVGMVYRWMNESITNVDNNIKRAYAWV